MALMFQSQTRPDRVIRPSEVPGVLFTSFPLRQPISDISQLMRLVCAQMPPAGTS